MLSFHLSVSDCTQNKYNTSYPHRVEIKSVEDLQQAAMFDHCEGVFVENHRSNETFLTTDVSIFDIDNDETDKKSAWKTSDYIVRMFPDVEHYIVYSRNNMKVKEGRAARPKFHVYFPRKTPLTKADDVSAFDNKVWRYSPCFDSNALDAARFIYGVANPQIEYVPGNRTIDEFMDTITETADIMPRERVSHKDTRPCGQDVIPEGTRNSTLYNSAVKLIKRYGLDDGYKALMAETQKCVPPLRDSEIKTIWKHAAKFYTNTIATDPSYIPPEGYIASLMQEADELKPKDYTDVGQAKVFFEQYGGRVRYSAATEWLVYDGEKWNQNAAHVQGLVHAMTDRQIKAAGQRVNTAQEALTEAMKGKNAGAVENAKAEVSDAKEFFKFVLGRRNSNRIAATIKETIPAAYIDYNLLDSKHFLLNTPDGEVNLTTGEMQPHNPLNYCTKMTAVSPSQEGAEEWRAFLNRLTCGDDELQEYLQLCAGMCCIGRVYDENLLMAYGEGGNGKSTFYNAQYLVLGDYSGMLSSEMLTTRNKTNAKAELAGLRGKRLVIAAELEEGTRLDTGVLKHLTSTDPIHAGEKYMKEFDYIPTHTLILYTNHLPKVGTKDSGTWSRIVVVPFIAKFRGECGEVKNYADYLFTHCGGAILSWMIEGAKKFIAAGCEIESVPDVVNRATGEYAQENDWIGHFIEERCNVAERLWTKAGTLYAAYREYSEQVGEYVRSNSDFKKALLAAGVSARHTKQGSIYDGISLKPQIPF